MTTPALSEVASWIGAVGLLVTAVGYPWLVIHVHKRLLVQERHMGRVLHALSEKGVLPISNELNETKGQKE